MFPGGASGRKSRWRCERKTASPKGEYNRRVIDIILCGTARSGDL